MRVGIVSDTHLPRFGRTLPPELVHGLRGARVECILHLGDFTSMEIVPLFEEIAPLDAVAGNNDGADIVARFGRRKIIELGGVRLGLVHGDAGVGKTTLERALHTFAGERVDAVLFGHSHQPHCARYGDRWAINPGSPTDKRRESRYSYGVLEITKGRLRPRLCFYAK